jgi:3-dehydroquinate synthase
MRGVPVVQVPTTLLAMVDASVGGKTGVDTGAGKNLVGVLHPPSLVVADPLLLQTLPAAELRAGMSEAVKHGAMLDADYFAWIEEHAAALEKTPALLERLVVRSVELKAAVAGRDPYEDGERAVLNFGHTVGHALEQQSGWGLAHGAAVAAGMVVEAAAGEIAGITAPGTADRLAALLLRLGLPAAPPPIDPAALLPAMRLDKKARRAVPRCALPAGIGRAARAQDGAWTHVVPDSAIQSALQGVSRGARDV